ncbi:helix-turn-helix transcriptional regulator [Glycomyces halotolerans]
MASQDMGWWFLKTMARKARKASGKSQREVGDEVYRSIDTIRAWEQGRTDIPLQSIKALARACGMSDELAGYMEQVARARRDGQPIEADMRYNALFISLAEEYCGEIFKWDANLIPGLLQTSTYHYSVVRRAEQATEEALDRGWIFKSERRNAVECRSDAPVIKFLIGHAALLQLKLEGEELYREQLTSLKKCAQRPGWAIRILEGPIPAREGNFSIYEPGDSALACPPFVYTEGHDSSWCIDDPKRFASYDGFRKSRWATGIRIEDYPL